MPSRPPPSRYSGSPHRHHRPSPARSPTTTRCRREGPADEPQSSAADLPPCDANPTNLPAQHPPGRRCPGHRIPPARHHRRRPARRRTKPRHLKVRARPATATARNPHPRKVVPPHRGNPRPDRPDTARNPRPREVRAGPAAEPWGGSAACLRPLRRRPRQPSTRPVAAATVLSAAVATDHPPTDARNPHHREVRARPATATAPNPHHREVLAPHLGNLRPEGASPAVEPQKGSAVGAQGSGPQYASTSQLGYTV